MNKIEYQNIIETKLAAANELCANLRKLRNLQKLATTVTAAQDFVLLEVLNKAIADKEVELKAVRAEFSKARRIVAKLEDIEAIESGNVAPKNKKAPPQNTGSKKGKGEKLKTKPPIKAADIITEVA